MVIVAGYNSSLRIQTYPSVLCTLLYSNLHLCVRKRRKNLSIAICFCHCSSLAQLIIASRFCCCCFFVYFAFVLFTSFHLDLQTQDFQSLVHFFCKWRQVDKFKRGVGIVKYERSFYNLKTHSNWNQFNFSQINRTLKYP